MFVPTYRRSAFLWVCLEAIRVAEPNIEIVVAPDRATEELEVCNHFNASQIFHVRHTHHGNTFNMMEGLKYFHEAGYDRVFVVEDDCVVDPSFFDWARNALDNPRPWMGVPFAASGWEYSPHRLDEDGPDLLLNWYLSVCSAIPRSSLEHIVQHAHEGYYSNMQRYCDEKFPRDAGRGGMHFEQDGLILKVSNTLGQRIVWPRRPRAVHIGFHGYHMPHGKPIKGDLKQQVAVLKLALECPEVMQSLMTGGEPPETGNCRDCNKLLVSTNKKAAMRCVSCFHKQYPDAPVAARSHYYIA